MANVEQPTLPDWLRHQAQHRPHALALRHKRLGAWHALSWQELAVTVERLAADLTERSFAAGDRLMLVSQPREQALLLSLAAQWSGGVAIPLDPQLDDAALRAAVLHLKPRFVFAEDDRQVDRLLALSQHVIDANLRDLPAHPHPSVIDYRTLASGRNDAFAPVAREHGDAFGFLRVDEHGQLDEQRFSHATLIHEARHLALAEKLDAQDEAFATRGFAAAAQARYLIAPWIVSGFRLSFPESLETRDNDRRELAPTLVAGTRETYARVAQLVDDRLPRQRSWRRKLIGRALRRQAGVLERSLTWWLIARPLREVIGLSRTHAALVIGAALDEATAAWFAALRVDVHPWPDAADWQRVTPATIDAPQPLHADDAPPVQPAY